MAEPLNPWGDEPVDDLPMPARTAPTEPATQANPWGDEPVEPMEPVRPKGFLNRMKDLYTGASRIDPAYKDAPEFLPAQFAQQRGPNGEPPQVDSPAISRSAIAPTEAGQLDILRKNIPDLQEKRDAYGNLLLKTPGMKEWAYLNKPGFSDRDVDEFGTQTLATLPFLGAAGMGSTFLGKVGMGAAGMGAASVAQDVAAKAAGSEQGIDPTRAAISAGLGAALPGVVVPAAKGVVGAARAALEYPASRVRGALAPDSQASRVVRSAVEADRRAPRGAPLTAPEAAAAAQRGQDLRVIDVGGESTRALARSAANQSPEARAAILNLTDDRLEGQSGRFTDFLRQLVQRPGQTSGPNAYATRESLEAAARNARRPLYDRAYADGAGGLMSPVLTRLETAPAMQSAMRAAAGVMQNRAAVGRTTGLRGRNGFTLEFWDQVKRNLDDQISSLRKSGANSAALDIDNLRRPLVDELDRLVGSYANARGTAQTFFRARDALEAGENFVSGRFNEEASRRALSRMTQEERDLFAEGFASRFLQVANKTSDRRSLLNSINNSPVARERFRIALGPNRARAMEAFMRIEGIMDLPRSAMGNSTTARQLVELGLLGAGFYFDSPESLIGAALMYGNRRINQRVAERVAQQLLSPNVQQFMQGLRQVSSTPMLDSLRAFDGILARAGIRHSTQGSSGAAGSAAPAATPAPATPPASAPPAPAPAPNPVPVPSVSGPGRNAGLQGREEAIRMAEEAIRNGAPADAVKARLAAYLKANNLGAA